MSMCWNLALANYLEFVQAAGDPTYLSTWLPKERWPDFIYVDILLAGKTIYKV